MSRLQKIRAEFQPQLPEILSEMNPIVFSREAKTSCIADEKEIQALFPKTFGRVILSGGAGTREEAAPLKVGVVFSGGQAAGGHNVISGLFDGLKKRSSESTLIGFLGGPSGIIDGKSIEITSEMLSMYRNQGGFDLIGSGRTKIETDEQFAASLETVQKLQLNGLVIIGGDDSNTNAALLAEYFLDKSCNCSVIGVPKTIDGDLQNEYIPISFGFDTAAKTYSEMIGNIERDALSAKKYYHFVKLMGRSASHITLECALATHPNFTLIGEEVARRGLTLDQITKELTGVIELRAKSGKEYGVVLIPEGLIEFIPEMKELIFQLNALAAKGGDLSPESIQNDLSEEAAHCFASLPKEIQEQLLIDRDPHGNVRVSLIETEKLLIAKVKEELKNRSFQGTFSAISHFFGYEGRAGFPSNFDTHYCYAHGHVAAALVEDQKTGYMTCVGNLHRPVSEWTIKGLPITMLMNMEIRKGSSKPVIQKALVDLEGKAFKFFHESRISWGKEDHYRYPGPLQFFGETEMIDCIPLTLQFRT